MITYREGSVADREGILALRRRCFPDVDVEKQDPRFWEWEFGGGRVFVATDGGRPVAHIGFVPQTYALGTDTVRGALAVDAMTDPSHQRQGIFRRLLAVAREAIRADYALSTAWQIRKTVLPAMRANGWEPVLAAPVLAKPLFLCHPERRARHLGGRGSGFVALATSPTHPGPSLDARDDKAIRGVHDLHWRFETHPLWKYDIDTTAAARIVTRRTTLKGFDTLAIADLAWTDRAEAKGLLRQACVRGKAAGATLAAALVTLRHPALPLFLGAGFLPTPHRFRLLVNVFDPNLTPRVTRGRWALLWGDTDHL